MVAAQGLLVACCSHSRPKMIFLEERCVILPQLLLLKLVISEHSSDPYVSSVGTTASAPYTRAKGVWPVARFGIVLIDQRTVGNSSIQRLPLLRSLSKSLSLSLAVLQCLLSQLDHCFMGEQRKRNRLCCRGLGYIA